MRIRASRANSIICFIESLRSIKKMNSFRVVSSSWSILAFALSWAFYSSSEGSYFTLAARSSFRPLTLVILLYTSRLTRASTSYERESDMNAILIACWFEGVIVDTTLGYEMPSSRMYNTKSWCGTSERSTEVFKHTAALVLLGASITSTGWFREAMRSS